MNRRIVPVILSLSLCLAPFTALAAPPSPAEFARRAGELLERNYRADRPGAAVLVARGDTILFRAARGLADADKRVPLRPEHTFRIGSVTKQMSAAGVLKLVEAGKVKLDDPLSRYVPGYPGGDKITVLQLLNHTSGVKSYTSFPGYMDAPIRRDMTTAQMIDVFKNEKPDFAPGAGWSYNNSGYVLVGAVIEAASGMPWHAYLRQALFEPLGMKDTGYGHDPKIAARHVRGHSYEGDKVVPPHPISMTQPHAAGSLVSTVDDLHRWNRALHEGRVLSKDTYRKMITPAGRAADEGIGYGFGIFKAAVKKHEALRHGGGISGFISMLLYVPGPDVTVVVLENDDVSGEGDRADTLARRLAALALGDPYPALEAVPLDAAALHAAEGVYRFDAETTRTLRVVDGKLTAQRGGSPRAALVPIAADDFLYEDGFNRLTLVRDAAGKITGARFFANGDGPGVVGARTGESTPAGVKLPRAVLERLAGSYVNGGFSLKVYVEGETLKAQLAGQPPVGLRAVSPTKFDVEEDEATLEFPAGDAPAAEATIRQGGRAMVLKRVP